MALTQEVDSQASRGASADASSVPRVRCAMPGEGAAIAALWRELWDAHQGWGGYPGSRDEAVYARVASRLDEDARVRAGRAVLGSHAHLVAELEGAPCGQVEGWLERRGPGLLAPLVCEVRSLVVASRARGLGAGRALLDRLAVTAQALAPAAPCVLAAEVLEPNPAHAFYARRGLPARGLERVRRSCGRRAGTGKERRRARRAAGRCARRIGRLAARGNPGRPPTRGGRSALRAAALHRRHPPHGRRRSPRGRRARARRRRDHRGGRPRGQGPGRRERHRADARPAVSRRAPVAGRPLCPRPRLPTSGAAGPPRRTGVSVRGGARRRPGRIDRSLGPGDRSVRRRSRHRRASLVARRPAVDAGSLPTAATRLGFRHELPRSCRGSACARARPGWRHLSGIGPGPGRSGRALG